MKKLLIIMLIIILSSCVFLGCTQDADESAETDAVMDNEITMQVADIELDNTEEFFEKEEFAFPDELLLKQGDVNEYAEALNYILFLENYNVELTDEYNELTYDAVLKFQQDNDLYVDGIAGQETLKLLAMKGNRQ